MQGARRGEGLVAPPTRDKSAWDGYNLIRLAGPGFRRQNQLHSSTCTCTCTCTVWFNSVGTQLDETLTQDASCH